MSRQGKTLTESDRATFLEVLAHGSPVSVAARAAGRSRSTLYAARDADEEFAAAWRDAWEEGADTLEEEARRRAIDGVAEPIYHKGELVDHVRRYSDALLMFLLKKRDPSFRDSHKVAVAGDGGGPVGVKVEHDEVSEARMLEKREQVGLIRPGSAFDAPDEP